ncbi:MAG: phenylalanine--tRNA ligase subunit beta [Spirochaetales bacterium]|nr:phenylalanine--tRNA ligase subunit beta [Spirochaetales bacterium]
MPKIEVNKNAFFNIFGKNLSQNELVTILEGAKAELDDWNDKEGVLKIELNDTNRPDLWSTAGLARQLKLLQGRDDRKYTFFSRQNDFKDHQGREVQVNAGLKNIRPYVAAFAVKGKPVSEELLKDTIQTQEKLCWNYGQKRKSIAMGVYRANMIKFPVHYKAVNPDTTSFTPLGLDSELTLGQILKDHPKGQEFGWILKDVPKFPFLEDAEGGVLSFPPIINSASIGALEVGDDYIFVEMTGLDMDSLLLATSIAACDFADFGYEILPVKIVYPYDTPYGREIVTPYYFQQPVSMELDYGRKLLGENLSNEDLLAALKTAGNNVKLDSRKVILTPSEYRNDFLHPVDVVEEVMIGRGMSSFEAMVPKDFTVGRLSPVELFSRKVRGIMIGLGFQEMIFNYLGSSKDFIDKMNIENKDFVHIMNPMTENYAVVRKSVLPNLLASESVSANAVYPHKIFEIGKVACLDKNENYGALTSNYCSFLLADKDSGFNDVNSLVSALFFYLSKDYSLKEKDDPRLIKGRTAEIYYKDKLCGIMGEIHPVVLDNWGIGMPCSCVELNLDILLEN